MLSLQTILRAEISATKITSALRAFEKHYVTHTVSERYFHSRNNSVSYTFQKVKANPSKKDVTVSEGSESSDVSTTLHTIKQGTKGVWYGGIFLAGFALLSTVLYAVFSELFSGKSPSSVYGRAFERCLENDKVIFNLGEPIKAYGEENSRGRRHHVSHLVYEKDGVNYMRMKFYVKGSRKTGTVHLEMKEDDRGNYEFRYLFVQLNEYPYTVIVLEDNRAKTTTLAPLPPLTDASKLL